VALADRIVQLVGDGCYQHNIIKRVLADDPKQNKLNIETSIESLAKKGVLARVTVGSELPHGGWTWLVPPDKRPATMRRPWEIPPK